MGKKSKQGIKCERIAEERCKEQEECFEAIKIVVDVVFTHPVFQPNLEIALRWPRLKGNEKQLKRLIHEMVQVKAEYCLSGGPTKLSSVALECKWREELVNYLSHVHATLKRNVERHQEGGTAMHQFLRAWAENPEVSQPKKPGPSLDSQDWTAVRDYIVAFAIGCADWAQNSLHWQWRQKLSAGRTYSAEDSREEKWRDSFSIFRAVAEVLEERYVDNKVYHRPTYDIIRNASSRFKKAQFVKRRRGLAIAASRHALGDG